MQSAPRIPRDHIFIATVENLATVIVSRQPMSATDIRTLSDAAERLKFNILARPLQPSSDPVFEDLLSATSFNDLSARASRYWLDVSPPTDFRPFFFNQLRLSLLQNIGSFADEYRRTRSFFFGESFVIVGNLLAMGTLFLLIFFRCLRFL